MHPLVGLFLLLFGLLAYAVAAVTVIDLWFADDTALSLLAFAVAGIAWVPPAAFLIRHIRRRR